jgi:hypothetical protein
VRRRDNHRLLDVTMSVKLEGASLPAQSHHAPRDLKFHIE